MLFLTFNRPNETHKTFSKIKEYKPNRLFIAQDGPRNKEEKVLTDKVRSVFDAIDWDCEVTYLIRDKNIWCTDAVVGAIDWFFRHVNYGVILEDDCVPSLSFFDFCVDIWSLYAENKNIMCVSWSNFLKDIDSPTDGYIFTKHNPLLRGRATRKDRWMLYNNHSDLKNLYVKGKAIQGLWFISKRALKDYMLWGYWDANRYAVCYAMKWLTVVPTKNLITNIWSSWIHSQRPWPYHNLPVHTYKLDTSIVIPIVSNITYDNEMVAFVVRMYVYKKISSFLKVIWLYTISKKLIIYITSIFYSK